MPAKTRTPGQGAAKTSEVSGKIWMKTSPKSEPAAKAINNFRILRRNFSCKPMVKTPINEIKLTVVTASIQAQKDDAKKSIIMPPRG